MRRRPGPADRAHELRAVGGGAFRGCDRRRPYEHSRTDRIIDSGIDGGAHRRCEATTGAGRLRPGILHDPDRGEQSGKDDFPTLEVCGNTAASELRLSTCDSYNPVTGEFDGNDVVCATLTV